MLSFTTGRFFLIGAVTVACMWQSGPAIAEDTSPVRAPADLRPEPVWKASPKPDADLVQVQDGPPKKEKLPTLPETKVEASPEPNPTAAPSSVATTTPSALPGPFGVTPSSSPGLGSNLLGETPSASAGSVNRQDLLLRPSARPGDIFEAIPGLIATPHTGGGKASQFILRGSYADHGTDFSIFADGVPLNLPSHAHGQGYLDTNWLIPELIDRIDYRKGPYYADVGDFSSLGTASTRFLTHLDQGFTKYTTGMYGYNRLVTAQSFQVGQGDLLYGILANYQDTAWENKEKLQRFSGILKYTVGDANAGFSVAGTSYYSQWTSTDQVPELAITSGIIDRFGTLDSATGGNTYRHSLNSEAWAKITDNSMTRAQAYAVWYNFDLFSLLSGPGSEIQQQDRRRYIGANLSHQIDSEFLGMKQKNTFGMQFRNDDIPNLRTNNTDNRVLVSEVTADQVNQSSLGFYWINAWQWTDRLRTETGLRWDNYWFNDSSLLDPANSGNLQTNMVNPKESIIFKASDKMDLFLNGGFGFHSNDTRGIIHTNNPDGSAVAQQAPGLVRSRGAEFGVRTVDIIPNLKSTAAVYYLDIDSELLFAGDQGTTSPKGQSKRMGVELVNYYNITKNWSIDVEFNWTSIRFAHPDPDTGGTFVPQSIPFTLSGGTTFRDPSGFFGSVRMRSFSAQPLVSDDSFRSQQTTIFNAMFGYTRNRWTIGVEGINLLNAKAPDITYAYPFTLVAGGPQYDGRLIRPTDPIQARIFFNVTY